MVDNNGSHTRQILIGNLLALTAALCWGFNEPANKALIPGWVSASGVAISRIFGAAIVIWIISLFTKNDRIERSDQKVLWFASLCMLGFVYVFSMAFNTASPIDIAIILTFQPMLVVAIHAIFKHEKVSGLEMIGMIVAFGGALLVILAGGNLDGGRLIGDLFALVCAVSYAAYLVIIEGPSKKYTTVNLMRWIFLYTAILSLPLVFTVGETHLFADPELTPALILAFIILFPTVYCYLVTPPAIKMIGSELLSIYQYLVPVVATVVSLLMRLDKFHWYQPVAFVIIVGGVVLANYAKSRQTKI
ncbi:MAG: DMT family transporter [Muribaculum sp.]|nr:DMT family transporter [Muribaculum sp.]